MNRYAAAREKQLSNVRAYENRARASMVRAVDRSGPAELSAGGGGFATIGEAYGPGSRRQSAAASAYTYFRSWVYVSVDAIARRAAGQAFCAAEMEGAEPTEGERGPVRYGRKGVAVNPPWAARTIPDAMMQRATVNQELTVYQSHAVLDLLARPNPIQKKFEFVYLSVANLLLTGESFWVGGEDDEGNFELWAVPTHWIIPDHTKGMYAEYKLQLPGAAVAVPLPPGSVTRTYLPNPADLKSALSPLTTALMAIRVDDYIQSSQEKMFQRGINPNLIVTVGRVRGEDGGLTDRRPVLRGSHRRQIIRAIREIWDQTVSSGDPAILDGLIESVHKLHNTPQEMDWPASGEIVKKRVMQAYKVNPIVVGEITAGNRAQAVEAEKNFCSNAVNPLLSALSETATDYLGPLYQTGKPLLVYLEIAEPVDADLQLREWTEARKNEDVTADEFRAQILGIAPLEDREDPARLLTQQGGLTGITSLMEKVGAGTITPEQAAETLVVTLRLPRDTAEKIAGVGLEPPEPAPVAPPPAVPPVPPEPEEEPEEPEELPEEPPEEEPAEESAGERSGRPFGKYSSVRAFVAARAKSASTAVERRAGQDLARYFRGSVRRITDGILAADWIPNPANAERQAETLIRMAYDPAAETRKLKAAITDSMLNAFCVGAMTEIKTLAELVAGRNRKTTAQDIAARLHLDVPDGVSIGAYPDWLQRAAVDSLGDTFAELYWQDVGETTATDIYNVLVAGIREGHSIARIAGEIARQCGPAYSRTRATNVARTEMTGAMNAGHAAGMNQISAETGLPIGKEWVSVMGSTTRPSHAAADGQQTGDPDGLFTLAGLQVPYPGHHSLPAGERCNCFPGSTLVRGRFVAATRAWYRGPLAEIVTGAGRRLTVTPQHPIATPHGWVAAGELKVGDDVLAYCPDVERAGVTGSHDVEDKPAAIEQVFEAFALSGFHEVRDGQPVDFDGDGQGIVGEIEIVRPGVALLDNRKSGGQQQVAEGDFGGGDVALPSEPNGGSPAAFVDVAAAAAGGVPGAAQPAGGGVASLVVGNVGPSQSLAVGIGTDFHATFAETAGQDRAVIAGILGNLLQRNAGGVLREQVVEVRNYEAFAGHVYDLQSVHGLVVAVDERTPNRNGGIVAANCQCTIISSIVMEGLEETIDTPAEAATPEAWDQAAVDKMDVKTVLAGHPGLREKMAKVDKIRDQLGAEIRLLQEELDSAQRGVDYYVNLCAEIQGPVHEPGSAAEIEQLKKYEEARQIKNAMQAVRNEKMDKLAAASREAREKTLRVLAVKTKDRLDVKAEYPEKSIQKLIGDSYKDDKGHNRSTGKYTRNFKHDTKQATDFLSRVVAGPRPGDKSKLYPGKDLDDFLDMRRMKKVRIHAADDKARAWHWGYESHYGVAEEIKVGISAPNDAGASTMVHEMGHHLESTVPGVAKRSKEFQAYRIAKAGTANRKMKEALPGYDYRDDEVGNEDDFGKAFDRDWKPGKKYPPDRAETPEKSKAYYSGKSYSDGQTELTSMGVQLLFDDPVGFAERDPEFFKYMMGVLDGTIR